MPGSTRAKGAVLDVVSRLAGLHAQLIAWAEQTLWAHVGDLECDAVQHALSEERSSVKAWAMRGTLHLLQPESSTSVWPWRRPTRC